MARITLPPITAKGKINTEAAVQGALTLGSTQAQAGRQLAGTDVTSGGLAKANVFAGKARQQQEDAARAAAEANRLESIVESVSNQIQAQHDQYKEQTISSYRNGVVNSSLIRATAELKRTKQSVSSEEFDAAGNPLYRDMPEKFRAASSEILNETLRGITDREAANQFRTRFKEQLNLELDDIGFKAREAQSKFDKKSTLDNVNLTLQQAAEDDPSKLPIYEQRAIDTLFKAHSAGIFDYDEFKGAVKNVKLNSLSSLIENSPADGLKIVGGNVSRLAKELGITTEEMQEFLGAEEVITEGVSNKELDIDAKQREVLRQKLEASIRTSYKQTQQVLATQAQETQRKQSELYQELTLRAQVGELTERDLVEEKDNLTNIQYKKLENAFKIADKKAQEQLKTTNELSMRLATGLPIGGYTDKDIENHYNSSLDSLVLELGRAPTLTEKAQLATTYGRPINSLAKEINYNVLGGSLEAAEDAVKAYLSIEGVSPALTSNKLSDDAIALISMVENRVYDLKEDPQIAIQEARKQLEGMKDKDQAALVKTFNSSSDYKGDAILETAEDALDADTMTPELALKFKKAVRQEYLRTGDMDAAKSAAAKKFSKTHANTSINGDSEYMEYAPETYYPGVDPSLLRSDLELQVQESNLIDDPKRARLVSGDFTPGNYKTLDNGQVVQVPRYLVVERVVTKDGDVVDNILRDPETDQFLYYTPNVEALSESEGINIEDLKQKREDIKKPAGPFSVTGIN